MTRYRDAVEQTNPDAKTKSMLSLSDFSDIHAHSDPGEGKVVSLSLPAALPAVGYFSIGVHPWDTASATPAALQRIEQLARAENVVAIGECGMDALRGGDLKAQEAVFRAHVAISERVGKPLIIHAVRTMQRMIELRRELHPRQRWVLHGFRGKPQMAAALLRAGFDLSYGVKYNPASYAATPADRRFHETDL